jgi:hypothetical protein
LSIQRIPVGGGTPSPLATTSGLFPNTVGLATDGVSVYWTLFFENAQHTAQYSLSKVPASGGSPTVIDTYDGSAPGSLVFGGMSAVAVDATSVYYASGGRIIRVTPK